MIKHNQKKQKNKINKIKGGNIAYDIIKTIEEIIQFITNIFTKLISPLFTFIDDIFKKFFKPDGAMPCTWSHLYFIAFTIAILLFIFENILIILCRGSTNFILKTFNLPTFNLNYWINFVQLNFILFTLILFLLQKGLIIQIIYFISGIWIKI